LKNKTGFLFGVFLTSLFSIRLLVEYIKESQGGYLEEVIGILSTGQWLSIPLILTGIFFMLNSKKT
jgi:phosphatidylglycerol:prolipoprotein diacylglycerol transferase